MKTIEVTLSHTIDLVVWTCPECYHTNEITNFGEDDGICEKCGFEIPNYESKLGECDGETEYYEIEEE